MSWLSITSSVLYYIFSPISTIFNLLSVLLAPLLHLISYTIHGLLYPLSLLGRFESLYIYFGVAALIGILTGSLLHFSSSMFIALFKLGTAPETNGCMAASAQEAQEGKKPENAWDSTRSGWNIQGEELSAGELKKEYADFLEKDKGKRKEGQGLLAQIILEEDDDSELGF